MLGQLLDVCRPPLVCRKRRGLVGVERVEPAQELAPIADRHHVPDALNRLHRLLDVLRRHVLSTRRDDQVLLAVGDVQKVALELADVARVEPAVDQRFCGRLGVLVVPHEHVPPLHDDLAIVRDLHLNSRERDPHRTEPSFPRLGEVEGRRPCVFRLAVDLMDDDADRREEFEHVAANRRGTGHRNLQAVKPQPGLQLRHEQPVARLILQLGRQAERIFAALDDLEVRVELHPASPLDDFALRPGRLVEPRVERVSELLPHPRNRQEYGRSRDDERILQLVEPLGDPHRTTRCNRDVQRELLLGDVR